MMNVFIEMDLLITAGKYSVHVQYMLWIIVCLWFCVCVCVSMYHVASVDVPGFCSTSVYYLLEGSKKQDTT